MNNWVNSSEELDTEISKLKVHKIINISLLSFVIAFLVFLLIIPGNIIIRVMVSIFNSIWFTLIAVVIILVYKNKYIRGTYGRLHNIEVSMYKWVLYVATLTDFNITDNRTLFEYIKNNRDQLYECMQSNSDTIKKLKLEYTNLINYIQEMQLTNKSITNQDKKDIYNLYNRMRQIYGQAQMANIQIIYISLNGKRYTKCIKIYLDKIVEFIHELEQEEAKRKYKELYKELEEVKRKYEEQQRKYEEQQKEYEKQQKMYEYSYKNVMKVADSVSIAMQDSVDNMTEEATKQWYILPLLTELGYNPYSSDIIPEYTADIGVKQGEKVDYLLQVNNKPVAIVECKKLGVTLSDKHISQLYRYFTVLDVQHAILTNGNDYYFFTDSKKKNIMDLEPCWAVRLSDKDETAIMGLVRYSKKYIQYTNSEQKNDANREKKE